LANQIQREIRALDPTITLVDMRTMTESLDGATGFFMFRLGASLAGFIGILGLILAAVGVYGVVSYTTAGRTQEIGVRVALGASSRQILVVVVNQGMRTVFLGVMVGLLGAWALTRMMTHMLVGVSSSDPTVYGGVSGLLCLIAFLACYLPARRAAKVDPMVTLRYD
jgi:ABC-type antimicrobial peptide transport system permease subunit